jgi:hypothetical protein
LRGKARSIAVACPGGQAFPDGFPEDRCGSM